MNLETLRRKRVKHLGAKTSNHFGQRRIFFILDRATRKFHGDLGLWLQYLAFARKQKSNKKVSQILTNVLRLHPTKPELWIYAANYAMEERGDMMEARSYMQRGLRFCKRCERLWLEYARMEMIYIAKIVGRRRILGMEQLEASEKKQLLGEDEIEGDGVTFPALTSEDINPDQRPHETVDQEALEKFNSSPALSGAIPIAVFDAAIQQLENNTMLGRQFFDIVANFDELPCQNRILSHIVDFLESTAPDNPETLICSIRQTVIGINVASAGFPAALRTALDRVTVGSKRFNTAETRYTLNRGIIEWILEYLRKDTLDSDIRKVFLISLNREWRQYQSSVKNNPRGKSKEFRSLLVKLREEGLKKLAGPARAWAIETWPDDAELLSSQDIQH